MAFDHSPDTDFRDVLMYCKTILFLVIEACLASDNPLPFIKNLLEGTEKENYEILLAEKL